MKKHNIVFALIIVLTISLSVLAGCGTKESSSDKNTGKTTESSENDTTGDNTIDKQDETTTEEKEPETERAAFLDDNSSYFIIINGEKFTAGDAIKDLSKVGLSLDEEVAVEDLGANTYMIGTIKMVNADNKGIFQITPYNTGNSTVKVSETTIGGISINESDADNDEAYADMEVYGGIKLGATPDEVKAVFGEPSYVHESTSSFDENIKYLTYKFESDETYRSFNFNFENDKCYGISWQNLVFNE